MDFWVCVALLYVAWLTLFAWTLRDYNRFHAKDDSDVD